MIARAQPPLSLRVLLVEDDLALGPALRDMLEALGARVVACLNAEEALALLADDDAFDLVLSDVSMPGMGGRGLMKRLAAEYAGLFARTLLMTGEARDDVADLAASARRPILFKPFSPDDLVAACEGLST